MQSDQWQWEATKLTNRWSASSRLYKRHVKLQENGSFNMRIGHQETPSGQIMRNCVLTREIFCCEKSVPRRGQWCLSEFHNHLSKAQLRAPLFSCEQPGLVLTLICIVVGHPVWEHSTGSITIGSWEPRCALVPHAWFHRHTIAECVTCCIMWNWYEFAVCHQPAMIDCRKC